LSYQLAIIKKNIKYNYGKNGLAKVIKPRGLCISFGWNTIGLGKVRGFEIIEVLIVSHGRLHNDTLVTVEQKIINPSPAIKGEINN